MEGEEVSHTEPVAAPSWLCCAPDPPCAIPSHAEASTAIPGAQGVWSMLYSTLPALTERVKAPLPDPLLLCLHRTPSAVRSPLDIGAASLALTLHCLLVPAVVSLQVALDASQLTSSAVLEPLEGWAGKHG